MSISPQVKSVIREEGITEDFLRSMVENAALTSISGYNRRFFNWLFKIEKDTVVMMVLDSKLVAEGNGDLVYEDHSKCDGQGCRDCGWTGHTAKRIVDTTEARLNKAYAQW